MAQFKSDTFTAQETASQNAGKLIGTAELISGKSAFLQCKVTIPAGTAAGDTILIGYLPSGMTVVPGTTLTVVTGTTGVFRLGVEGSPNAIANAVAAGTGGTTTLVNVVPSFKNDKRQPIIMSLNAPHDEGAVFYLNFLLVNSN